MNQDVPCSTPPTPLAEGRTSRPGWLSWIVDPITQWSQDHCLMFSASIAFFAAFSLAPTLVIVILVASIFFGADAVQGRLFDEISGVVGADAAHALEAIVANAWHADIARSTAILSLAGVLLGASATFSSLHSAERDLADADRQHAREHRVAVARAADVVRPGRRRGLAGGCAARARCARAFGDGNPFILLSTLTQRAISLGMLLVAFTRAAQVSADHTQKWRDALLGAELAATAARKRTHRASGWR